MKVIKKSVEVDAWKVPAIITDLTIKDAPSEDVRMPYWALVALERGEWGFPRGTADGATGKPGFVETDRGRTDLAEGDWLMRGTKGEIYPCSNEVFHEVYEYPPEAAPR